MNIEQILELKDITKKFPGIIALDNVSFTLNKGEVHALVGENGAGKSTLMNIIAGAIKPDNGMIFMNQNEISFDSPYTAIVNGISTVYQELSVADLLTIRENIFTYNKKKNRLGFVKNKQMNEETKNLLSKFDKNYDPDTLVKDLPLSDKQVIEILKSIQHKPQILILDEPTSSLSANEVVKLFELIREIRDSGNSIIYISHHLSEIFDIADRVTVLRDGRIINTYNINDVNEYLLVADMVGREMQNIYGEHNSNVREDECLKISKLNSDYLNDISFVLRKGEILGIYGLIGAGRTELAETIFGILKYHDGEIYVNGEKKVIKNPKESIKLGIAYASEDRKNIGIFLKKTIRDNIVSTSLKTYQKFGWLNDKKITRVAKEYSKLTKIKSFDVTQMSGTLSGGNQQKLLLARWFQIKPQIIIFDEPTKGVDIGAKEEIYQLIRNIAAEGTGVIMISSDLPECIGISDRILVMRKSRIVAELNKNEISEENIALYATGVNSREGLR